MKFMEVETKYKADNISLVAFTEFCRNRDPKRFIVASGYDHFYTSTEDSDSFCRHRVGPDSNQLTFKRKTSDNNNFIRTEHNLDLTRGMTEAQVAALCAEFGYAFNTSIFKNCFVYTYDWYTLVYYVCYDLDLKELGRFVEIEMKEGHDWRNEEHAWTELQVLEKLCKPLGVSPQSRIKRSLYEMYKK